MHATTLPTTTDSRGPSLESAAPTFFHLLFPSAADAQRWTNALAATRHSAPSGPPADRVVVWLDPAPSAGVGLAHAFVSRGAFEAAIAARIGLPVLDLVALRALPAGLRLAVGTDDDARLYQGRAAGAA